MATQIEVTKWCDVHLYEHNENVPAETIALPVPGTVRTVELCTECEERILGPVRKIYDEYGAKPDARNTPLPSRGGKAPAVCPECGSQHPDVSLMRAHVKRIHKDKAADILDLHGKGYVCTQEGCDFEAIRPQGLGAHLRQAHGIAGTSKTARHNQALQASA